MTFEDYLTGAQNYYVSNKVHLRKGQAYMNYLYSVNKGLYHAIPWDLDPFYEDKYLYQFLTYVESRWDLYYTEVK